LTARERLLLSLEAVVQHVNNFLRGCPGYFRCGDSARSLDRIGTCARADLAVHGEARSQTEKLRLVDGRLRVAEPFGPDRPQWTRHCSTTESAVAGQTYAGVDGRWRAV
jgi:hypothetical protein